MIDEENKKRAQLEKQLSILTSKMSAIRAKHTKDIWTDSTFDCDRKDVLRNAELTLRLSQDAEYQSLQGQVWTLEAELTELGGDILF